jgi:hypothetical protein
MTHAADDMNLETARLDPGSVFRNPDELREFPGLSREQKIDLLQRWAEDARELEVAESEGMGGGETSLLGQILSALESLGVSYGTR